MKNITASITYNSETISLLEDAVFDAFGVKVMAARLVLSVIMFGAGLYLQSIWGIILIVMGALLITSGNFMGQQRGKKMSTAMGGRQVHVDYTFEEAKVHVVSVREDTSFRYDSIIRLMEKDDYYYLFPTRRSGYMIEKKSVNPPDQEAFKKYLAGKVGLKWTVPASLLRLNLHQLIFNSKNTRKK